MFKLLILATIVACSVAQETFANDLVVETTGGFIEGKKLSNGLFGKYYSFRGIPYAEPPVGDLRFKAPVPHRGWSGTRKATAHGPSCPSSSFLSSKIDEDCLTLNVYAPNMSGKRAVMVWIHGGSFSGQNGDDWVYGPEHIMDDDVIMVSINYRLGILGFMSTGDTRSPGNYGLKDMVLALKWVRDNIAVFGGDPNKVTIFGESAGGAAVHYLVLSSYAKGLFNQAISQSGSAFNPWAYQPNPKAAAISVARSLGYDGTDVGEVFNVLMNATYKELVKVTPSDLSFPVPRGMTSIPFVPCRDPQGTPEEEKFIVDEPINLLKNNQFNQVPYISGFNSAESVVLIRELLVDSNVFPTINKNPELLIPYDFNMVPGSKEAIACVKEIRDFYFRGEILSDSLRQQWTEYLTDGMFASGIDRHVLLQSERQAQPVFYYKFSFDGSLNLIKNLLLLSRYPGAVHGDDIFYMFKVTSIPPPLFPTNSALTVRKRMVKMWTDFAKTGSPTPKKTSLIKNLWTPVMGTQEFMDIGENLIPGRYPNKERLAFWKQLREKYAK